MSEMKNERLDEIERLAIGDGAVSIPAADLRALLAEIRRLRPVSHVHQWFRTGAMERGKCRCIECGEWADTIEPTKYAAIAI